MLKDRFKNKQKTKSYTSIPYSLKQTLTLDLARRTETVSIEAEEITKAVGQFVDFTSYDKFEEYRSLAVKVISQLYYHFTPILAMCFVYEKVLTRSPMSAKTD